ncbi:MAG: hypothetical protein HOI35_05230 [Woeseia sp.]|jgi:hypothetical protein|nr:hypothetical protein [Woeseia sp.]MBT6209406.1 hypothetical protein [Woeseia sp.]
MNEIGARRHNAAIGVLVFVTFMIPVTGFGDNEKSPRVQFSNSCSSAVQGKFNRAITLLHSFEYLETTRLFGEITNQDPDCAMAYWGSAMSIWHPLWAPPSKSDLEEGAALLANAA